MNPDDWDYLLPVVEYALNHRNLPSLAGKTPIEIMTGRKPRSAPDLAFYVGKMLKEAEPHEGALSQVTDYLGKLTTALDELYEQVADKRRGWTLFLPEDK